MKIYGFSLNGKGIDTSSKRWIKCRHFHKNPDNFYSLRNEFEPESLDFIVNKDLFDTKYYPILLKEWAYALKQKGLLFLKIKLSEKKNISQVLGEIYRWTYIRFGIEKYSEDLGYLHIVLRKIRENDKQYDIDKWTFGIITLGKKNDVVEKQIQSIRKQKIPNYEIIICGTYYNRKEEDIKYMHFSENDDKGWITKKKNIICENATYQNIMVMHDRIMLDDNWFKGMKKYGNNFEVLSCMIKYQGNRAFDWLTVAYPYHNQKSRWYLGGYLEYSDWDPWVYVDGGSIILKKWVWELAPWDNRLFWGEAEDLKLSHNQACKGLLIRFNPYSQCTSISFGHPVSNLVRKKNIKKLGGYRGQIHLIFLKNIFIRIYKFRGLIYNIFGKEFNPEKGLSWGSNK